jgi:ABC-2 type transport system permease protein
MNIIKREMRANLKSLLIWCAVMFAIVTMMMSEFSAYYDNPEMADILESMPQGLLEAFSMAGANLTTVSGFVSLASLYFYIMLGIFAVLLGTTIISKEERDKTVEFFMTLPISREQVITSKLIAAVLNCLALNLMTGLSIIITTATYKPDQDFYEFLGLLLIALFLIELIFMSLGMFLAATMKRYKKSGTYAVSILLGLYIMSILVSISDKIEYLKYVTPFKYFEAATILSEGKLEFVYVMITLVIIIGGIVGTFMIYPKRDLNI